MGKLIGAILMATAIALIFTGPGLVAKKNWEYGGKSEKNNDARKDAKGWFVVILVVATLIIFLNS